MYWRIQIDDRDIDKTTFTSHHGLHRYLGMPFSLKNAPTTFQRAIDIILSAVMLHSAFIFVDDVVIFSRSVEEHPGHLQTSLRLLSRADVSLKL